MKISTLPPMLPQAAASSPGGDVARAGSEFGKMLDNMLNKVNDMQQNGDQAIAALHKGEASHLHEVVLAVEQADISLRMLVQMRNKALTAYEEIMRMQI